MSDDIPSVSLSKENQTTPISASKNTILQAVIGDGSFEHLMKERSKIRKEKDEYSIAELRVQMKALENALCAEIRRRIQLNREIEQRCESQVQELQHNFQNALDERTAKIQSHLSQLEDKMKDMNLRLEEEKQNIPKDIERKGRDLKEMLESFQEEYVIEKKDRIHREGRILKQMHDYESHVQEELDQVQKDRDEIVLELREMLEKSESGRKEAENNFQQLITKELETLRKEVQKEIKERKLEDDEIVEALNRYTRNLQASLSVISSVEE